MITFQNLVRAAQSLASEDGDNHEYDRALIELVGSFLPGDGEAVKAYVQTLIVPDCTVSA